MASGLMYPVYSCVMGMSMTVAVARKGYHECSPHSRVKKRRQRKNIGRPMIRMVNQRMTCQRQFSARGVASR